MAPLDKLSTLFPAFLDSDEEIEEFKVSTTLGERIKHIVGKGKRFAGTFAAVGIFGGVEHKRMCEAEEDIGDGALYKA